MRIKFITPMTTKCVTAGQRVGRLCVLGQIKTAPPVVLCICDCGKQTEVHAGSLLPNGKGYSTKSCGCLRAEGSKPIHGKSYSAEYGAWRSLKKRCLDPRDKQYQSYGGRGITVCKQWRRSFQAFYGHIGPKPSSAHSVDRIDNNRGYEPGNVRWATAKQQNQNTRSNRLLTIGGVTLCAAKWEEIAGLPQKLVVRRLARGWEPVDAVFAPPQPRRRHFYSDRAAMLARLGTGL